MKGIAMCGLCQLRDEREGQIMDILGYTKPCRYFSDDDQSSQPRTGFDFGANQDTWNIGIACTNFTSEF